MPDLPEVDEPPGDQEQHAGHGGRGQIARQGRHQQHDDHQHEPGEYGRERGARARLVVDPATVEGAGNDVTGEERPGDVGQALADEFLVAVDAVAALGGKRAADGDRLGEREQGDGERGGGQLLDVIERQGGRGEGRQTGGAGRRRWRFPPCLPPAENRGRRPPDCRPPWPRSCRERGASTA